MSELDQLIDQALSSIRRKPQETEKLYVVDVTMGRTVAKLWTLNKKSGIVVPIDSKVQEILNIIAEGKIAVVEVEKDSFVQRRNIVKVRGGIEIPDEKMIRVNVEPDRSGVKLTGDGILIRPDPFSYNTQRLLEKFDEGTTEVLVLPVCCDSMGRCYGIQWKPLKLERYIPTEYRVEPEMKFEDVIKEAKQEQNAQKAEQTQKQESGQEEKLELELR